MSDILLFRPRLGNLEPPGELSAAICDQVQGASGAGDPVQCETAHWSNKSDGITLNSLSIKKWLKDTCTASRIHPCREFLRSV